jgi:hypothetical protein
MARPCLKKLKKAGHQWLTSVILATEAEIRRITVQSQPGKIVPETLSQKIPHTKGDSILPKPKKLKIKNKA